MRVSFFSALPLTGVLLTGSLAARAQAPDTTTTYQHQLGLTASPVLDGFFRNNRSLPLGLLYKRQLAPSRALRLRLVGQYSSRDTSNYAQLKDGTGTREWQINFHAGYEWQRRIAKHLHWFYGLEVGGGVGRFNQREVVVWSNNNGPYQYDWRYTGKRWQAEVRPFAGLAYNFTPRLCVLVETAASLTHRRLDDQVRSTGMQTLPDGSYVSGGGTAYYKNSRTSFAWRPVQLIGVTGTF